MNPELAQALAEAQSARTVATISLVATVLGGFVSGLFAWWTVRHGERERLRSELRLRVHEQATASVAEAVRATTDFYVSLDNWAQLLALGADENAMNQIAASARVQHRIAHNSGLMIPPLLDHPLDTTRRAMARCVGALEDIEQLPREQQGPAARDALVMPFATLSQFRSTAGRWRRAMWRELAGPDPQLEDDDAMPELPRVDRDWLEAARRELGGELQGPRDWNP